MCFKNGKQLHINNCLADKLINMVINWLLDSYLCEKQLNKYKDKQLTFCHKHIIFLIQKQKQHAQTSLSHIGLKTMSLLLRNCNN